MANNYIFYYDESEHSRSITKETINANNFASNFVACIIGYESNRLKDIDSEYQLLEEQYKKYFGVEELKSTIIGKSKYKYGLKKLKSKDLELVNDVFDFVHRKNLQLYLSLQNKIEYVVNQLLNDYDNELFFHADAFRYSISKIINQYKPKNVIDSIYANDGGFIVELKNFLNSLLDLNKENPNKVSENSAIKENLLILNSYNKKFLINWNYRISFSGFKLFLSERVIKDYCLIIDKEGDGNTINAAISESVLNPVEVDSKDSAGIRIADMIVGIVSRFAVAINEALSYKNIYDGQELKFLSKEWFDIDEIRFNCYKLIKKVIVDVNESWYKTYCSHYSDDFLYFVALINYFDSYKNYDEYKKVPLNDHPYKINGGAIYMLQERFNLFRNKLKIDPLDANLKESEFYYNQRGAKCYFDYKRHKELKIDEKSRNYNVLSVGFFGKLQKACITINEKGIPMCYLLPDELREWAFNCVVLSNAGGNVFPAPVVFTKKNGKYYADIE